MNLAVLFSGGKDSVFAAYLAKKSGHKLSCLITMKSENRFSYMYHTPSISCAKKQAESIGIPLMEKGTKGNKEIELEDLENAIREAKELYQVRGVVTGAVESVYQASRIQKICDKLGLELLNPLWQRNPLELLNELVKNEFEVIVTGVAAHGLDKSWLGRRIDGDFIGEVKTLNEKFGISPVGEGGEFETFVLNCPLFAKRLNIKNRTFLDSGSNYQMEIEVE